MKDEAGKPIMQHETYAYSKTKMRKRRWREAAKALPSVIIVLLFGGLFFENPIAQQVADALVEYWSWVFVAVLMVAVFGLNCRRN